MPERIEVNIELLQLVAPLLGTGSPIQNAPPANFSPLFYILCVPKFTVAPDTGFITYQYDTALSGVFSIQRLPAKFQAPDAFAKAVASGPLNLTKWREFEPGYKAMEFGLRGDAYLVFALPNLNWQFNPKYYAVTVGSEGAANYGDLHQIDEDGNSRQMPVPTGNPVMIPKIGSGCTVAYFSAKVLAEAVSPSCHPFNLHVQILQGNRTVDITIDPDIKNDGTQPTWPP